MATTDDILADPIAGLALPDGSIPLHVIIIAEYAEPGSENFPGRLRLAMTKDEDLSPWTAKGMLAFTEEHNIGLVMPTGGDADDDDG